MIKVLVYLGLISLIVQIMFVTIVLLLIKYKKEIPFSKITIGIARMVIAGIILTLFLGIVTGGYLFYQSKQIKPITKQLSYQEYWSKGRIDSRIQYWAKVYNVPVGHMYALQKTENEARILNKVGGAQEVGLFQPLPSTFYSLMPLGSHIDDPEDNIKFAAMHLASLYKQSKNWRYSFSAYNSGSFTGYQRIKSTRYYVAKIEFYIINGIDAKWNGDMLVASR